MAKHKELKKRLKELSFSLPNWIFFEEKKEGIRVASKKLMSLPIKGKRGFLAFKEDLTHSFVLTFGNFSDLKVALDDNSFKLACEGKKFTLKEKDGRYIATYKGFPVCMIKVKNNTAIPIISKGFKRKIKTTLN